MRPIDVLGLASLLTVADRGSPLWRYATEELIAGHYAFAVSAAKKFHGPLFEDRVQAACLGLVEAAVRWNPYRNPDFIVYARFWMFRSLRIECRKMTSVVSPSMKLRATHPDVQRSMRGDASLDVRVPGQSESWAASIVDAGISQSQLMDWEIEEFLRTKLGDRDASVFMRRMGLYGPPQEISAVAREVGIGQTTVVNIMNRAKKVLGPELLAELAL